MNWLIAWVIGTGYCAITKYFSFKRMEDALKIYIPLRKVFGLKDYFFTLLPIWHLISGTFYLTTLLVNDKFYDKIIDEIKLEAYKRGLH